MVLVRPWLAQALFKYNSMNKTRKLYAAYMSYEVPSEEKDKASKAIRYFQYLLKIMKTCDEHLELMHTPFKDNNDLSTEQAYEARAALRRYRDKAIDNFNTFKEQAFKCFILLQPFSVDTQFVKLNKSFVFAISDIEKQVNKFAELFSNIEAKEFGKNMVAAIESIKKEMSKLHQIIEDRIIDHIQTNILARNWVDNVSDKLQEKVENKIPLAVELVNERRKMLEGK
jgi:hypothetical protein